MTDYATILRDASLRDAPQDEVLTFSYGFMVRSRAAASRTMLYKSEIAFTVRLSG
jgi:hypothetical protein